MKKSMGIAARTALLFSVTMIVLLLLLGGAHVYSLLNIVVPVTQDSVVSTVNARGDELGRWFAGHVQELHRYASQEVVREGSLEEIQQYLESQAAFLHPEAKKLIYADWQGDYVTSDGSEIENITSTDYYSGIVRGARPFAIGAAAMLEGQTAPVVTIAHEVRDADGRIRGLIAQTVESGTISEVVSEIRPTENSFAMVADPESYVAAHPNFAKVLNLNLRRSDEKGYVGLAEIGTRMMRGFNGMGQYSDPDGNKFYAVYSEIPDTSGWSLAVVVPAFELMRQVYFLIGIIGISLVAMIISVMVLMNVTSSAIVRPVSTLSGEMAEITRAMDFTRRVHVYRKDEIGQLGDNFNKMATELEESFTKIREYSENLENMVAARTKDLNTANAELKVKNETMDKELFIAQRVQRNILPDSENFDIVDALEFASSYTSMEAIGGDLFGINKIGQTSYGFFIVDVSGHGVPAALITMLAKVSFTTHAHWDIPSGDTCTRVNESIFRMIGDMDHYLTAYFCKLDLTTGVFEYTNCGHHPGIVIRGDSGEMEELDTHGILIGAFEDGMYETKEIQLQEGDRILLFTDGIVEARNEEGVFYDDERLFAYIERHFRRSPSDFVDGLVSEVDEFCGTRPQDDDRAVLLVEFASFMDSPDSGKPVEDSLIVAQRGDISKSPKKYRDGLTMLKEGKFEEALAFFEKMLERDPDNAKLLNYTSAACYSLGHYKKAMKILRHLLDLGKDVHTVRRNMEKVRQKMEG